MKGGKTFCPIIRYCNPKTKISYKLKYEICITFHFYNFIKYSNNKN